MTKLTPEGIQAREEAKTFTFRHILIRDDRVLLILNAHLVIEKHLRSFLASKFSNPEALNAARLTFHQILLLAKAFHEPGEHEWLWNVIIQLNKLRNELAHNVKPEDFEIKLKNLIESTKPHIFTMHGDTLSELEERLLTLCGFFLNLSNQLPEQ